MPALQFDPNYVRNTLIPYINSAVFATELGSNSSKIGTFSYAGSRSNSSYSFGLFQYDVGANPAAQKFLTSIGFTSTEISQLSQKGGLSSSVQTALSNKLTAALKIPANAVLLTQLNNAWANGLVNQLQNTLNQIYAWNPTNATQIFNSTSLQVQLIDYGNQFHLDTAGGMAQYLAGKPVAPQGQGFPHYMLPNGGPVTAAAIQFFIMHTKYGLAQSAAEQGRQDKLQPVLSGIPAGLVGTAVADASTPPEIKTITLPPITVTADSVDDPSGTLTEEAKAILEEAVKQAQDGVSDAPDSNDGTTTDVNNQGGGYDTSNDGGLYNEDGGYVGDSGGYTKNARVTRDGAADKTARGTNIRNLVKNDGIRTTTEAGNLEPVSGAGAQLNANRLIQSLAARDVGAGAITTHPATLQHDAFASREFSHAVAKRNLA